MKTRVVVLAVALAAALGCGSDPSSPRFLGMIADAANKELPRTLDNDTVLERLEAQPKRLVYTYRMSSKSLAEVDVPRMRTTLRPKIVQSACDEPETRELLTAGVTLRHVYLDKDRVEALRVEVIGGDCG